MAEVYGGFGGEEVKRESSWRYALAIFAATLVLSAFFLYHYVGPSVDELSGSSPKPTISDERATIVVASETFSVPANHTVYPRARRDGARESLSLYALWPTMAPYSPARRSDFVENDPRSRRIDIFIDGQQGYFDEAERLDKLYLPLTLANSATRTPSGLVRYSFVERRPDTPTNGFRDTELFVGAVEDGRFVAILCTIPGDLAPAPDCRREYEFGGVSVTYRFKRPYLAEWRAIDARVRDFVDGLHMKAASVRPSPTEPLATALPDAAEGGVGDELDDGGDN